jgi:beta-N-acetylhexosaminidase
MQGPVGAAGANLIKPICVIAHLTVQIVELAPSRLMAHHQTTSNKLVTGPDANRCTFTVFLPQTREKSRLGGRCREAISRLRHLTAQGTQKRRRLILALAIAAAILTAAIMTASGGSPSWIANAAGQNEAKQGAGAAPSAAAKPSELEKARRVAAKLTPAQLAGQRLIAGVPGTSIPPALRRMIARGEVAGVILFADNFPSRDAGRRLVKRLQSIKRPARLRDPLLVTIDQEGGLVKRIGGAPAVSAAEMGRRGAAYSRRQGYLTGRNLRNVGVNVDLAPVVDVARRGGDIADTYRAFGYTREDVIRTAIPFAQGLRRAGIAATAKHFPGLGAVSVNTDFASQTIRLSKRTLRRVDEAPYRAFIEAGGEVVMLGTAIYPAFSNRPAAFTRQIVTGELRDRLGFEGVTITDAMGTVAVRDYASPAKATFAAAQAGVDLLLYTDYESAIRSAGVLRRRMAKGKLKRADFIESVARVLVLRKRLGQRL